VIKSRGEVVEARGKEFEQVNGLRIKTQIMHFLPKFTKSFAENIQALHLNDNFLKAITKDDLVQFPNLKELSAGGNDIMELSSDLFQATPNLMLLDFNKCKLKTIGADLLSPLKKLKIIRVGNAQCINFPEADNKRDFKVFMRESQKNCSESKL
jgi:Leucine-rich repeat (LRR) protein